MPASWCRAAWSAARDVYRTIGLLVIAALGALALGAWIHHRSRLPSPYTWLEPLRTMKDVLSLPDLPVAALITYLVAKLARRGDWDAPALVRRLNAKVTTDGMRGIARRAGCALTLAVADAHFVGAHTLYDNAAMFAFGWQLGGWTPDRATLRVILTQAVVGLLAFTAVCYFFTVIKALTLVSRPPVDSSIIRIEEGIVGIAPHRVLASWGAQHPGWVDWCDWAYFRFFHHMLLTTVLLVGLRQSTRRTEYLAALAFCYLIGGPLYHLWPGKGPSYWEPERYAHLRELSMHTWVIRRWLLNNTDAVLADRATVLRTWGYIACMPSLHIAQEVVMLWYAGQSRIALAASIAFTSLTMLAVVVLGWHYPLDSLGGVAVAAVAILLARWQRARLMPALAAGDADARILAPRPFFGPFVDTWRAARGAGSGAEP